MESEKPVVAIRQIWPLLFVHDIERSVAFYRDGLGFTLARRADAHGKMFWCRLERGVVSIMLQQGTAEDGAAEGRGRGVVFYLICDDADAIYAEFSSRGLRLDPPTVVYYAMKQLVVPEPDGYALCFESEVTAAEGSR